MADLESTLQQLLMSGGLTSPSNGAPGPGDASAIAKLILGGGSASVGGNPLFGPPIPPAAPGMGGNMGIGPIVGSNMGGPGNPPSPSTSPGVVPGPNDIKGLQALADSNPEAADALLTKYGFSGAPGSLERGLVPPTHPEAQISPDFRSVLDNAKVIAASLSSKPGEFNGGNATLLANPYGPGSFNPYDQNEVAKVKAQGDQIQKVDRLKQLMESPGIQKVIANDKSGELMNRLLDESGITGNATGISYKQQQAIVADRIKKQQEAADAQNQPLGGEKATGYFVYDPNSKSMSNLPEGTTPAQLQKLGAKKLTPAQQDKLRETDGVIPSFFMLQALTNAANNTNVGELGISKLSGGRLGGSLGADLQKSQLDFSQQFDKLMGGTRGAASPQLLTIMKSRLPGILDDPKVRSDALTLLEPIIHTLHDNVYRTYFGLGVDPNQKNMVDAAITKLLGLNTPGLANNAAPAANTMPRGNNIRFVNGKMQIEE